jgi:hypothetical protein
MAEGYGLEPGQMIEEGSKGREKNFATSEKCRVGFLVERIFATGPLMLLIDLSFYL